MRNVALFGVGIVASVIVYAARAQEPAAAPAAAPAPTPAVNDPAAQELQRFAGFWKPESVQFDGAEQLPDAKSRSLLTLVVKGSEFRAYYCTDPKTDTHFRLFTADLTLDPAGHTFELNVRDGQKKGEKRHGIYELTGSTLKMCYGPADRPRPTSFAAPKGSGIFCETWAMEKR